MKKRIGLALSGGGYRAAAFHLGVLKKLNDLGILNKIDVMSTISGGSIVGAKFCCGFVTFDEFFKEMGNALLTKNVISYVLTSRRFIISYFVVLLSISILIWLISVNLYFWILVPVLGFLFFRFQFKVFPFSEEIEKAYDNYFFNKKELKDLVSRPTIAIGSTNLETFRPFTFSENRMGDSSYTFREKPLVFSASNFPIARAVCASTCVPSFFNPVRVDSSFLNDHTNENKIRPLLVDGGIYDNQGVQKLTQKNSSYECEIVIASDAGRQIPFTSQCRNTYQVLVRTMDAFMARIKNFQMAQNIYNAENARHVCYISLSWNISNCVSGFVESIGNGLIKDEILKFHNIPPTYLTDPKENRKLIIDYLESKYGWQELNSNTLVLDAMKLANSVTTDLRPLTESQFKSLIGYAQSIAEVQLRLYLPQLFM